MAWEVDIVVVAFNSRDRLRSCVADLALDDRLRVTVVDNASPDAGLEVLAELPVDRVQLTENRGFAYGCNVGWRRGTAPFVLFLNPDARISPEGVLRLKSFLAEDERAGVAAPKILDSERGLDFSQRRFPRLRSTYARALYLHRLFPDASWVDEVVRAERAYDAPRSAEWVSGACMLVRRAALEEIGGLDEKYFMYCEDEDLCRRIWDAGYAVRFTPDVECVHEGGASAPRAALLPVLAESRLQYAATYFSSVQLVLERFGIALEALIRVATTRRGLAARVGHARALAIAAQPLAPRKRRESLP